jgi:hypothetical protein
MLMKKQEKRKIKNHIQSLIWLMVLSGSVARASSGGFEGVASKYVSELSTLGRIIAPASIILGGVLLGTSIFAREGRTMISNGILGAVAVAAASLFVAFIFGLF